MKKLILMFILTGWCLIVAAQSPPEVLAKLDKFVGTWIYKKDGEEVKIVLKEAIVDVPASHATTTMIEGYHIYIANNKTVDNSVVRSTPSLTNGFIEERDKPNKLKITYIDPIKKKISYAILIILPGDPVKMQWSLHNKGGIRMRLPSEPVYDKTFTLPENMILTKEQ